MDLKTALNKLFSMKQMGVKLGLENIYKLLSHLGNPQNNLKVFHIAGSNGKGSTAAFLSSMLIESGYKTGLYTSPHLVKFNERIRINGIEISDEYIADFVSDLEDYIDREEPTFFEITTALAFKYFADNNLNYCVIETGLGGRLDATNTLIPLASLITSISLEHTRILGDTLEKIAFEKGGIIKANVPVFIGKMPEQARVTLSNLAAESDSPFFDTTLIFQRDGDKARIKLDCTDVNLYSTPLVGNFQYYNLTLAAMALDKKIGISGKEVLDGIRNVHKNSGIQGRFEIHNAEPLVLFDAAHNDEGITATLENLDKLIKPGMKKNLIFGAMADKDLDKITKLLTGNFDQYYITTINFERAADIPTLEKSFAACGINPSTMTEPHVFIQKFINEGKNEALVVMGSIYILGDIKEKLLRKKDLTF
ncbi:MAG: bifunctional folylpolyglutamate synthase/dihydrofolate synthase [Melioribacteraceae bacterium]|nr:MAG: bifunctional folylpolyglutamate synthase/dihydrofolate synthase [Melioribacteraceae bacterium]